MKVGLIGCGNIGSELASFIDSDSFFDLAYVNDIDEENIEKLILNLKNKPEPTSLNNLVNECELIIECANKDIVKKLLTRDLSNKKVMILSTGGLLNETLPKEGEFHIPTGAISGIDSLKAVSDLIDSLEIVTTKPSHGLNGAPYIQKNNINLDKITEKTTIFEGSIDEAIEGFPKNINVAATIHLATKKDIKIKIIADPNAETNTHEIIAIGSFGKLNLKTQNKPSKNPKTSYLAVLSGIQTLKNIQTNIKIGA